MTSSRHGRKHRLGGKRDHRPGSEDRDASLTNARRTRGRLPADHFLNRELGWLEFNARVLHEAADPRTPLLERANFMAIFTSNLDEFVMKRVGLLEKQLEAGTPGFGSDRLTPRQQLNAIRKRMRQLLDRQADIYQHHLLPALAEAGVEILRFQQLDKDRRRKAEAIFRERIFPILTPLSVDPGHPFPFISNLSTSLGVMLRQPHHEDAEFARIKVPDILPHFVLIERKRGGSVHRYVHINDLISHHLSALFPGMEILEVMPFRVTRNADVERYEEEADDLMDLIAAELRQRRLESAVRLEVPVGANARMVDYLREQLELEERSVFELPALLDYTALRPIAGLMIPDLRYEHFSPQTPPVLQCDDAELFATLRKRDILVHHPYESFATSVERFVRVACDDLQVAAIKITLYRTDADSPFIPALIRAAETGKQVVAVIELKARFDEERNIRLAQLLEKAGVHVVYGVVGLKTHTKTTLVVRREGEGLRCYAHIGSGNYHRQTARLYTDFSLLTCDPELTADLVDLFLFLTGRSLEVGYRQLLVAPFTMQRRFLELIERETANQRAGRPARIVAKMNALNDEAIIAALYRASQAGVPIDLIIRGFCCLRPGVPGLSETIRVISIIGRFLEHSRVFHFAAGEANPLKGEFYLGSADWMTRNLINRVEVVTPIDSPFPRQHLWETLQLALADQRQAWVMKPDGSYHQRQPKSGASPTAWHGTHASLLALTNGQRLVSPPGSEGDRLEAVVGADQRHLTADRDGRGGGGVPTGKDQIDQAARSGRPRKAEKSGKPGKSGKIAKTAKADKRTVRERTGSPEKPGKARKSAKGGKTKKISSPVAPDGAGVDGVVARSGTASARPVTAVSSPATASAKGSGGAGDLGIRRRPR